MAPGNGNAAGTDYGVDAPAAMRNLFLAGFVCLAFALFTPRMMRLGQHVTVDMRVSYGPQAFSSGKDFYSCCMSR